MDEAQQLPADQAADPGRGRDRAAGQYRARQRAEQQRRRQPQNAPHHPRDRALQQQAKGPAEQHDRDQERGEAEALHQEIGEERAVAAEEIGRRGVGGGVE